METQDVMALNVLRRGGGRSWREQRREMINSESIAAVRDARINRHFLRPIYEGYGFASIPQTVRSLLTGAKGGGVPFGPREDLYAEYDAVILFFVDAFGWRFFEEYAERHPFLRRIVDEGLVCKLTSQFPSTTAAHVTAIHTGLPVGESGVYEWFYYEPRLDAVIAPLLFSFAGDHGRDTLAATGVAPEELFPTQTLYQDLGRHGVRSYCLQDHAYAFSPYTAMVTAGATLVPYRTLPEAIVNLSQLLDRREGRSYYLLYYDRIDAICHLYGPDSPQMAAEILTFLDVMERLFHGNLMQARGRTLFLMTADHGQTAIDPATTVYLNRSVPELEALMQTSRAGRPLVPAGSSRDMFLHIREGSLDEAQALLERQFEGRAEVRRVSDLIEQGFFGSGPPSRALLGRVGNLVILPFTRESAWWYEEGRFDQHFYGQHGGLTPDEMETILLAQPYG